MSSQWIVRLEGKPEQIKFLQEKYELEPIEIEGESYLKSNRFNDFEDGGKVGELVIKWIQENNINEVSVDSACKYDSGKKENCLIFLSAIGYVDQSDSSAIPSAYILPVYYLDSAYHLTKSSYEMEQSRDKKNLKKNISYVTGVIVISVCYLEATINRYFIRNYKDVFYNEIESKKVLDKYQKYLQFSNKSPFDKGKEPYQSIQTLIKLRNYMIHYKIDKGKEDIEKLLQGKRGNIKLSPLADAESELFPDRVLSYSLAKWAFKSVVAFTDEFFNRLEALEDSKIYP